VTGRNVELMNTNKVPDNCQYT